MPNYGITTNSSMSQILLKQTQVCKQIVLYCMLMWLTCQTSPAFCLALEASVGADVNLKSHTATVPFEVPETHLSGCEGWVAMLWIWVAVPCTPNASLTAAQHSN